MGKYYGLIILTFFSNYIGNLLMSPTLHICVVGSFCVKSCLSHFCVMLTIQGLNPCWPFCSCLDLLCWPFPGISSLDHVFSISFLWNSVPILDPISPCLTSCWMMKDALMPSFQWICSYWLQHLLLLEWDLEFYDSTLGIVVLNGNFPRYWVVGIP